jgi:predicted nucleotidyltransferase
MRRDATVEMVDLAALALKPLLDRLVLIGGCAVALAITDMARPPVRPTEDIDFTIEVVPRSSYPNLSDEIRDLGFKESLNESNICRWVKPPLKVDIVPADESVLGFTNSWCPLAVTTAIQTVLPSGRVVKHANAPVLIATKLEAFADRGRNDYSHHDVEDIINIIDGRPELMDEIDSSPSELREFLREELDRYLADPAFVDSISIHLRGEPAEQARAPEILSRLRRIAGL